SPAPPGIADLRAITSPSIVISGITDPNTCLSGTPTTPPCSITIRGTTVDEPPSQPNGGGFNSSFSIPGDVIGFGPVNVRFVLGVQQPGSFKFYVNTEAVVQIIPP
ncbi:MAG TPA: hypothetical protein VN843_14670, partial [Anaerolineales bacterium]|nr:hypothetical protein [Anaerolineales bacterium]